MQQASYLEGGPLIWILPLYLHVNTCKKLDDDDEGNIFFIFSKKILAHLFKGTGRAFALPLVCVGGRVGIDVGVGASSGVGISNIFKFYI